MTNPQQALEAKARTARYLFRYGYLDLLSAADKLQRYAEKKRHCPRTWSGSRSANHFGSFRGHPDRAEPHCGSAEVGMTALRPYQVGTLTEIDQVIAAGKRRPIVVAPTGAGKTVIAAAIIKSAVDKGQQLLVLAHTREIIKQTSEKLFANDIEHGIIQAGFATRPDALSAGRERADTMGAGHADAAHGITGRRSAHHRRGAPLPRQYLSQDHRRLSARPC